jgi:NADH:ubiquinone reductase (H+-translocating)
VLPRNFRDTDTSAARIVLLEGAASVLPAFDPRLQRYAQRQLERMGVEIRLNTLAVAMDHDSITVRGEGGEETMRARTRIWAAGVSASPLAALLAARAGLQTDRAGRLPVAGDCTVPGYPDVFAIGDMVSLSGLPGVAQPAIQEGRYVARVIRTRAAGEPPVGPFRYSDRGSMATIGHRHAVVESAGAKITGTFAYLLWGVVHLLYLIGWSNRLGTVYSWACAMYLSKNRSHRLISFHHPGHETAGQRTLSRAIRPHAPTALPGSSAP